MIDSFAAIFAQVTNAVAPTTGTTDPNAAQGGGGGLMLLMYPVLIALVYFAFFRPQAQARKKQEALVKSVKTGDRVVTSGGIHGVVSNVKDSTVMVKVADNVKLEVEKAQLEKIVRTDDDAEKVVTARS